MKAEVKVFEEMKYSDAIPLFTLHREARVLAVGLAEGRQFVITNVDYNHPCCYVQSLSPDDENRVDVHGGVTYRGKLQQYDDVLPNALKEYKLLQDCDYIGWDYAHCNDYDPRYPDPDAEPPKTVGQLVTECLDAICQLSQQQ